MAIQHAEYDHPSQNNSDERRAAHFTLSVASSRSTSPAPHSREVSLDEYGNENQDSLDLQRTIPSDVYDATLPWWRAALRRWLVKMVARESRIIAKMQSYIRTPFLDSYFVYTSSLGTHTFFIISLPVFFFFGYDKVGRGLLIILALGVYFASFLKDLICSPRPFAPPVTRLTIGTHHLEYGFPSTHSTNSVSIALMLYSELYKLSHIDTPAISLQLYTFFSIILSIYTVSIVFGRLYTAMHSFIDCFAGVALGVGIWWAHEPFPGFAITVPPILHSIFTYMGAIKTASGPMVIHVLKSPAFSEKLEAWVQVGGYEVPLLLIPITLLAVNQHPQPVDDCPCFEDAIAFGGVVLGAILSRWAMGAYNIAERLGVSPGTVVMPGSGWHFNPATSQWTMADRGITDILLWWGVAGLKIVLGILMIFTWRLLAKSLLHIVLPPVFRFLAKSFRLPHRRFYTPATQYKSVPSEFNAEGGLRPIPSVIDLPMTGEEIGGIGSGSSIRAERGIKLRGGEKKEIGNGYVMSSLNPAATSQKREQREEDDSDCDETEESYKKETEVKHYDADVLTKVFVYSGIAVLACELVPLAFDITGLGIRSSPYL